MKNIKSIITLAIVIILMLMTFKCTQEYYVAKSDKIEEQYKNKIKKSILQNDSLTKLAEGLYTKRIADTLTIKELQRVNDSLGLELKKPKTVIVVQAKPKDKEKDIDTVTVTKEFVDLIDYYPSKENPFVRYSSKIYLDSSETAKGKFSFYPMNISLGIEQGEDGIYKLNTKTPDWLSISDISVQSLPLETKEEKVKNFGFLVGAGMGEYLTGRKYLVGSAGIRYKKYYFNVDLGTNETLEGKFLIEF